MSGGPKTDPDEVYAANRAEWRSWLEGNHSTADRIYLIYFKVGAGKPTVSYDEAVEEALCFGWIDSKVNSMDDERYKQIFTPRKPGSPWSKSNKDRIARMIKQGRMTTAGSALITKAKADGSWSAFDGAESLTEPSELREALDAEPGAREGYEAYTISTRKAIIYWITSAKRDDTKARRIDKTVSSAIAGEPPVQ